MMMSGEEREKSSWMTVGEPDQRGVRKNVSGNESTRSCAIESHVEWDVTQPRIPRCGAAERAEENFFLSFCFPPTAAAAVFDTRHGADVLAHHPALHRICHLEPIVESASSPFSIATTAAAIALPLITVAFVHNPISLRSLVSPLRLGRQSEFVLSDQHLAKRRLSRISRPIMMVMAMFRLPPHRLLLHLLVPVFGRDGIRSAATRR